MIKFNIPFSSRQVIENIQDLMNPDNTAMRTFSGDGKYSKLCHDWFDQHYAASTLLTHSCTAALEMSGLLSGLQPGDEVIMPSYTFVSTANAFALRGAIPVFVDVRADNFNIDEKLIEQAITTKTKAIVVVHYAGVACAMDEIVQIAAKHRLYVIEDAAQAFGATYKGENGVKKLGSIGDFGCLSFHETKNISSGEGGLLIANRKNSIERAEILREKGTNRSRFFRGKVDKYTWVDIGSSYLPSDLVAAYLYAQLPIWQQIQNRRLQLWQRYRNALLPWSGKELTLATVNDFASNNAHMFYLLFENIKVRSEFITFMRSSGIMTPFHYVPLHSSPAGEKFGRAATTMTNCNRAADCLVRLPLYFNLTDREQDQVIDRAQAFLSGAR